MTSAGLFSSFARIMAGLGLCLLVYIALGIVMTAAAGPLAKRGQMIDIGGRRLRLVCQGPELSAKPVVILEAGAFGFAADWGVVQDQLAAQGVRSCAYDRAGMGFSDPGPKPRDGINIAEDLEKLLIAAKVPGPYVLCGHSMGGLRLRQFASRNPDKVVGIVLVDATTPEAMDNPQLRVFVGHFARASHLAGLGASVGLFKPLMGTKLANKIGLTGEAQREKRHFFANGRHNRVSAQEVAMWPKASDQARAAAPFKPQWPVAVVTAGGVRPGFTTALKQTQEAPARASQHGYVDHVEGASHNSLLGPAFADRIVKGVDFVIAAAAAQTAPVSARVGA
jgi:pimeloyl-ACP methyl ester carboxylesterase